MSDYRRFVSYIYLYEHGMKSMNTGFAKVESRHGQCRISVVLKNIYTGSGKLKVYMFVRSDQELRGILLGELLVKNHVSEWSFKTNADHMAGSEFTLDQISGLIIQGEEDRFYGTKWDQGTLDIRRFVTEWQDQPVADMVAEVPELEVPEPEVPEEVSTERDPRQEIFIKILEQCPGMYPFDDDEVDTCVRLEPQDIGRMPMDCWSYGSNSFLLHGYYSYRHLIFARMGEIYILGVPGTKHSRETFMANMFGFHSFKPICKEKEMDFGYWYTQLE